MITKIISYTITKTIKIPTRLPKIEPKMDTFLPNLSTEPTQKIKNAEGELTGFSFRETHVRPLSVGAPPQADDVPSYACRHLLIKNAFANENKTRHNITRRKRTYKNPSIFLPIILVIPQSKFNYDKLSSPTTLPIKKEKTKCQHIT